MSCLTSSPTTLSALNLDDPDAAGINYYVKVDTAAPSLTINFIDCTSLTVTPTPSTTPGTTSVTFTTDDLDTEFEIDFSFRSESEAIIEDPTTKPKFKPVGTCP